MKRKRLLAALLAAVLLALPLAACQKTPAGTFEGASGSSGPALDHKDPPSRDPDTQDPPETPENPDGPDPEPLTSFDFERAFALGLLRSEWRERAGETIGSADFRAMLAALVERFAPEQMAYFDESITDYDTPLTRGMGFVMAYYTAKCLGVADFNNDFDNERVDEDDLWNAWPDQFAQLMPHCGDGPETCGGMPWNDVLTAAYLFSFWHSSPISRQLLFDYDEETGKMRQGEPLTVFDAAQCLVRLFDSVPAYVDMDDERAAEPNGTVLTPELLAAARELPEVTADNHPVWTGFIFGEEYSGVFKVFPDMLEHCAEFGFNSARIKLGYETLFSADARSANANALTTLDIMVKTAMENGLHLNLCLTTLPGRTISFSLTDYTSTGDLDLFVNPDKQAQADEIWRVLARRYRDVPSACLSFTPFWEATNRDLSTGLPSPDYTPADVGRYLARVAGVIREQDPDRLLIYEPTSNNPLWDIESDVASFLSGAQVPENCVISYNFCQQPYVYAEMTATDGENIDANNHSIFLPDYPNTIYAVDTDIEDGSSMTLDGLLPAGTTVDVYLSHSYSGRLDISADGQSLYSEDLETRDYQCGPKVSRFYPFAQSEKKISVTLPTDTGELVFSCAGGCFELSGIDLTLPGEYAVERWYYASGYDVFLGNEEEEGIKRVKTTRVMICPNVWVMENTRVHIQENLTCTTDSVLDEASAERAAEWGDGIEKLGGNCVVRFEVANFMGTTWESMRAYYEDLLAMCADHGYSWWSNDWHNMTHDCSIAIAGVPCAPYGDFEEFNLELLELLQKYQSTSCVPKI